jgi:uncharacterized protein with PIN domain
MSMDRCPNCKKILCDVGVYYSKDQKKNKCGYTEKKRLIKCPLCGKVSKYEEWK